MNAEAAAPHRVGVEHPPRRRWWAVAAPVGVVLLTIAAVAWSAWPVLRPAPEVRVVQAVFDPSAAAAPVGGGAEGAAGKTVQAAGWLEAEPYVVACTALADGVVETIEVLEGDAVEAGQVVARLVDEDAQLRVRRAEAELAAARAELALGEAEERAALAAWDEPVDLERAVDAGRAALAEARAEVAQLPSLLASARATLVRLEEELVRAEGSRTSGAATELEVIVARQAAAAQRAEVAAVEARGPLLEARAERLGAELRAAERNLDLRIEDRRRVDATRARLAAARAAVSRAEAARDEAGLELERMVVRAPISGRVQQRLRAPGDKVVRMMDDPYSAHLVHLYDPERLQVRVDVPLADAGQVSVGQRCEVVVEVLPDTPFEGVVLRTTHEADVQKNTLQVKVKVIDPEPLLRPEMLTRVKFLASGSRGGGGAAEGGAGAGVLVPEEAVDRGAGSPRVWVVAQRRHGRGVLRGVEVEPGAAREGWVALRGVQPGALLALPGPGLRDGLAVEIEEGRR